MKGAVDWVEIFGIGTVFKPKVYDFPISLFAFCTGAFDYGDQLLQTHLLWVFISQMA